MIHLLHNKRLLNSLKICDIVHIKKSVKVSDLYNLNIIENLYKIDLLIIEFEGTNVKCIDNTGHVWILPQDYIENK